MDGLCQAAHVGGIDAGHAQAAVARAEDAVLRCQAVHLGDTPVHMALVPVAVIFGAARAGIMKRPKRASQLWPCCRADEQNVFYLLWADAAEAEHACAAHRPHKTP